VVLLAVVVVTPVTPLADRDFDVAADGQRLGRKFDYTSGTTTTTVVLATTTTTTGYHKSSNTASSRRHSPVARTWQVGAIKCDDSVAVAGGG
jgi:hypothetical protein